MKTIMTLAKKYAGHIKLTKKEKVKSESISRRIALEELRLKNPSLVNLNRASESDLLRFLEKNKITSPEEGLLDQEFYEFMKGETNNARKLMLLMIKVDFNEHFKHRRFKSSPKYLEFIKEIQFLQKHLLEQVVKKERRKDLIKKQRLSWHKQAVKDVEISVYRELVKKFLEIPAPTQKDLNAMRTKVRRAKRDGFL